MARHEADREDLVKEATAMVERAEIRCDSLAGPVTAGFRKDGRLSIYVDQDPVYQFDSAGLLRRAYVGGFLYRSEGGTLAELQRSRSDDRTTLVRRDLSAGELSRFRGDMHRTLQTVLNDLLDGSFKLQRQIPGDADIVTRVKDGLHQILALNGEFLSNSIRPRR
ncbi:MAG: hypothetical protein R3C19_19900 [Planctomycetaceae bacterium]